MSNGKHVPLLFHKDNVLTLETRLTDLVCFILFIFGIVGNVLGLFIFSLSRRTWRISPTYACLATCSSITNLLCVLRYASILHSTSRNILGQLVGQTWWACKFYEFSFSFRVISSWITLFWTFERLMCVSSKLRTLFNPCNSFKFKLIISIIMIIFILSCVIGPPIYMYQPLIIPNNGTTDSTINIMYCGLNPNASVKWQKYFLEIHLGMNHFTIRCFSSELIPTGMVILLNCYIIYYIVRTCRYLHQARDHEEHREQSQITSWMNAVLIVHSSLFSLSLISHIVGHFIAVEAHEKWWVLLTVLINCSINFYIYCLSGKAFRYEICRFIQRLKIRIFNGSLIDQDHQQQSSQHQRLIYKMTDFQGIIQL